MGDAGPAPGVDLQLEGDEGFDGGAVGDAGDLLVADVLAADHVLALERKDSFKEFGFPIAHRVVQLAGGWVHGENCGDLQKVVLHDVKQAADAIVEGSAVLHAEAFGHGDLDGADVLALPHGLEDGVGEAGCKECSGRASLPR